MHKVYLIEHTRSVDGAVKSYVGVTIRTLEERLAAHLNEASRGRRSISPYSLGAAIRAEVELLGSDAEACFAIRELQSYESQDDMLHGEAVWIGSLRTMAPQGYNLMPGGCSAGGVGNAKTVTVFVDGQVRTFSSIGEAARAMASQAGLDPAKFSGRVYARRKMGWTDEEALDLTPHEDRRGTALSRAARESGIHLDTLRSQKQRAKVRGQRVKIPRGTRLPDPHGGGQRLKIADFATAVGVPKSTVGERLRQIGARLGQMSDKEIINHLCGSQNPTKLLKVYLHNGTVVEGGHNELARLFAKGGPHSTCKLGEQALRKRLGEIGDAPDNDALLAALGVSAKAPKRRLVIANPVRRRKLLRENWSVECNGLTLSFARQADFTRACLSCLEGHGATVDEALTGEVHTARRKRELDLQKKVSKLAKSGLEPVDIAKRLGVFDYLATSQNRALSE